MNQWQKLTAAVIIATTAILIAYDFWAIYYHGLSATISLVIWDAACKIPAIPFAAGLLLGHLFLQNPKD